jgi:hypothetical protein
MIYLPSPQSGEWTAQQIIYLSNLQGALYAAMTELDHLKARMAGMQECLHE